MGQTRVWNRLFWREFRESIGIILLGLIAPAVLFSAASKLPEGVFRTIVTLPAAVGVPVMIALWAAGKGDSRRNGSEFSQAHLPVSPVKEWVVSMLVPAFLVAGIGAWYGFFLAKFTEVDILTASLYGALDMLTTFLMCYYLSMIVSKWLAILFGIIRLLSGGLISVLDLMLLKDPEAISLTVRLIVGLILSSLLCVILSQKKSLAFRQATSLILLLAIALIPMIGGVDIAWLKSKKQESFGFYNPLTLNGGAIRVDYEYNSNTPKDYKTLCFIDYRIPRTVRRDFPKGTTSIAVDALERVYLMQVLSRKSNLQILKWDTKSDKVQRVATLPVGMESLIYWNGISTNPISPDGKYLMIELKALWGDYFDLWIVNLRSGRSTVVMPNTQYVWEDNIIWYKNHAVIHSIAQNRDGSTRYGDNKAIKIDLTTLKVSELKVSIGERS